MTEEDRGGYAARRSGAALLRPALEAPPQRKAGDTGAGDVVQVCYRQVPAKGTFPEGHRDRGRPARRRYAYRLLV